MSHNFVSNAVLNKGEIYIEYTDYSKNEYGEEKKNVSFLRRSRLLLFAITTIQKRKAAKLNIAQ